jgi:regulator of protease activity HflC (stomatin/prohibitin superfamily)
MKKMKKMNKIFKHVLLSLGVVMILGLTGCGFERIDAGYEGIQVNKYGSEKGVDQIVQVTGAVWYNKIREDIYEVPIFMQDYNYDLKELKTSDMMTTALRAGVQVKLPEGETPALFVKYRNYFEKGGVNLDELIFKHVRKAFSNAVGLYKAEELITKKQEFAATADSLVTSTLGELGFQVEGVFLLADPSLPEAIQKQVDLKIQADQIAQTKESELRQKEADAAKAVVEAQGKADAMRIEADAEAYAYQVKLRVLTPLLVEQQWIDKWDGNLGTGNVYGVGTIPTKNISR